ncbi:hypothetical protein ACLBOM_06575 [Escherichia coli]
MKEGKTGQAVELFNQLPQELERFSASRENTAGGRDQTGAEDFCWRAKLAGENHTCRFKNKTKQARYWQAKIDASQGAPSIDFHCALIAQGTAARCERKTAEY